LTDETTTKAEVAATGSNQSESNDEESDNDELEEGEASSSESSSSDENNNDANLKGNSTIDKGEKHSETKAPPPVQKMKKPHRLS